MSLVALGHHPRIRRERVTEGKRHGEQEEEEEKEGNYVSETS